MDANSNIFSNFCCSVCGIGKGFGIAVSPSTMLTRQYSIRAIKTNLYFLLLKKKLIKRKKNTYIVQTDIKASTAFKYETGGREACDLACCVERVSSEVTPNVTPIKSKKKIKPQSSEKKYEIILAGAASGLIQKDTQDIITIKHVGTYVWKR